MAICSTFVIVKMSILRYEKSSAIPYICGVISTICTAYIGYRTTLCGYTTWRG